MSHTPEHAILSWLADPKLKEPVGTGGPQRFRAGGTVEDAGKEVSRVRLTDSEGRTFEDTVDGGVFLFMSDEAVAMPMRVDLFDGEGRVVGTDEWGFVDE